ncbi:uncharacterized protein Z518_02327 [Rhinocladiella mackenziei CBS 650.93]|uniref:NB-ARC domain-containing protein n=1 Tax=Rhinocladiella mackenziei CBS 650.93 TaxID=1442369 RepID=A0A0D2HB59_9EURO|nr:uncharacterized protein Z518_02327 [Rhinocladiella mackenziei CBS 650.93]KIX07673.1 hypothetical protein Z518_02327 [Rhinocladiella mackenziei CBS 650.93]
MEVGRNTQRDLGRPAQAQIELLEQMPGVDLSAAGFPCHEIPASDENFLGRSEDLERIDAALNRKQASKLCIVVISGFGGAGKSALALKAAHKYKEARKYDAIFWLNAEDPDVLRESYNKMACRLLLQGANGKSDKDVNYMLVKNWLDKTSRKWLLIYDNVDDEKILRNYLPPDAGTMIITTRYQSVSFAVNDPNITRLQLEKFNPEDSLRLFNHLRVIRDPTADINGEIAETKELLEEVDGLALGIKQMACYIAKKRLTIPLFREKYTKMAKSIINSKAEGVHHALGTLWRVQFLDIQDTSASKLLGLLSLCAPNDIPRELFEVGEALETANLAAFCDDEEVVENAIDELVDKALIEMQMPQPPQQLAIHRLTQQAFLYDEHGLSDPPNLQATFDGLVSLLDRKFPRYGREKSLTDVWDICASYLPHVSALARTFDTFQKSKTPIKSSELFAELLKNATWYLQEIGEIQRSQDLLRIAFDACEDKRSLIYAYLCNTKVVLAMELNDMAEGQKYSAEAISIREEKLAPDDLDLAISYGNSANILLNEGRYDEALANHALSDKIWADNNLKDEEYQGLAHLNIGRVYSMKGKVDDAVRYFETAERVLNRFSNDMFLIGVHYTWATLLMNQGDKLGALGKFQIARTLAEKSTPHHLSVSAIHYKIAVLELQMGLLTEAKANLKSAMALAQYHKREAFIARIGRQQAIAIEKDPNSTEDEIETARELRRVSEETKRWLWKDIGRHISVRPETEDEEYSWLVAAWYR